jgi:hypothetical protein
MLKGLQTIMRVYLPAALMIAGIGMIGAGRFSEHALEVGVPLFSAGSSIWFVNFLWRVGVSGEKDRVIEGEARAFFAEHGHWPDEAGHPGTEAPR